MTVNEFAYSLTMFPSLSFALTDAEKFCPAVAVVEFVVSDNCEVDETREVDSLLRTLIFKSFLPHDAIKKRMVNNKKFSFIIPSLERFETYRSNLLRS